MADDEAYEDFQNYYDNGYDQHDRNSSIDYYDFNHVCEKDDVRRFAMYFLPPFYAVTLIAGLAGNAVVVAVYAKYKRMRSKTDLYIMNLAIADLLLLVTLPFWAANAVHGWVFGEAMCKICSALSEMNFCAGMLFLACISVDRYLAVSRGARPPTLGRKAGLACLGVWLVAVGLSAPDVVFSSVVESHGRRQCVLLFPPRTAKAAKATVRVFDILLAFAVPSLVMLYCYTAVARAVRRGTERKGRRALRVLLAVVGVFFLTQLPYNVVKFCRLLDLVHALIRDCEASKMVDVATQVTESIALFHCCINPILYAFMGASFRGHVLKAVKRRSRRFWRRDQDVAIAMETSFNLTSPDSEHTSSFSI